MHTIRSERLFYRNADRWKSRPRGGSLPAPDPLTPTARSSHRGLPRCASCVIASTVPANAGPPWFGPVAIVTRDVGATVIWLWRGLRRDSEATRARHATRDQGLAR